MPISAVLRTSRMLAKVGLTAIAFLAPALLTAGCGSSELAVQPTFDGTWSLAELQLGGDEVDLTGAAVEIEIDTGEAAVRGRTGCRPFFGSYTLIDDGGDGGAASFTIPSPDADESCSEVDQIVHRAVVDALESVTQWRRASPALELTSETASNQTLLVLTPAG